jgi:hypothetical protein
MKLRLPRIHGNEHFRLFIADAADAPADRWFGSLKAALRAFDRLDERWKPLAWIIEQHNEPTFGGIPVTRDVVHLRYGVRTEESNAQD